MLLLDNIMQREDILDKIKEKSDQAQKLLNEIDTLRGLLRDNNFNFSSDFSEEDKIDIFMSYFRGRDTVYPYLSINRFDPTKKYFMPKCANEWKQGVCNKTMGKKCKTCQYWSSVPLDREVIRNHLFGNSPIGIYPMVEDETCYFLALDFDNKKCNKDIKQDVLDFSSICEQYNIPIAIERSRSGNGFHIWIFFDEKIHACIARKLGSLLLSATLNRYGKLQIDSFDRMFPNQDTLPNGGYGSLIALPLQYEPLMQCNTAFVDKNFIAFKNQYDFLNKIRKISLNEIKSYINLLSENVIDVSNGDVESEEIPKRRRDQISNAKFPAKINIILSNMIYIEKKDLNAVARNYIKRLATFSNPEFYKKQRMRISVYNTPMIIDCSKEDDQYLMLPRGVLENLQNLCEENNIKIKKHDKRNKGESISVEFNGILSNEQEIAVEEMLSYDNGILQAPTGFGKTVLACKMIAEKKISTLIVTDRIQILHQWQDSIAKFLNINDIGQVGGGKNLVTGKIDVASIKSIWNRGKFMDMINNYGMIIIDECHHLSAYTYENAINKLNARYVYGLSATPEKENGHTPIIKMQCGDIRYKVDAKRFNMALNIPMKVIRRDSHLSFYNDKITDYGLSEIDNMITKDILRSEMVIKDIMREFKNRKNILVLTDRLEHMKYLGNRLSNFTDNIFIYHGGLGEKVLKKYKEREAKILKMKQNKIVVATGSYIGEGFDDATLDVLFLTMPASGVTKITQSVGRLHRRNPNKEEILIYDYVDDNFRITRNMYEKRKKIYRKLGYEISDNMDKTPKACQRKLDL